jgi:hypothetical protein
METTYRDVCYQDFGHVHKNLFVIFEAVTAVAMKSRIIWETTLNSTLKVNRRFGRIYQLHHLVRRRNQHEVDMTRHIPPKCRLTAGYTTLYPGRQNPSIMYFLFKNESAPANTKCIDYKTLIRSVMNSACPTWEAAVDTNPRKIQRLQNRVLSASGKCDRSTLAEFCMCHSKHLASIIT